MNFRKILFWAHLIVGVAVGLIILTMAVTGAILAFEPQLVENAEKRLRHVPVPSDVSARLTVSQILEKASQAKPASKPAGITLKADGGSSVTVSFGKDGGVFMDPYTGKALGGISGMHHFMHFVEDIHRRLAMKDALKETGEAVTGAACLAFFFMLISGVYLWWPKQWNWKGIRAIVYFDGKLKGKARDWNWHNVIGIWSAPFILVTVVTGLVMAYPWANDLLYRAAGTEPPPVKKEAGMGGQERPGEGRGKKEAFILAPAQAETLISAVQTAVPDWESINFRFPQKADASSVFNVSRKGMKDFMRTQLTLDTATGGVKKIEPFSEQTRGKQWRVWARYLHTGDGFGFLNQVMVFWASLAAALLVWTGFALSWRRFFKK